MTTALTLTVLIAAVGAYLIYRSVAAANRDADASGPDPLSGQIPEHQTSSNFRSVGLDVGANCCQAALNLAGERFEIRQAPELPLESCEAEKCHCKLIHFADRRSRDYDRRSLWMIKNKLAAPQDADERRSIRGRHKIRGRRTSDS